jgi:hypothetical protein
MGITAGEIAGTAEGTQLQIYVCLAVISKLGILKGKPLGSQLAI